MSQTDSTILLAEEYARLLQRIVTGEVVVYHTGITWDAAYCGNVEFEAEGWRFTIFNDCDELDYTDSVTAPDGRTVDFDGLYDHGADPICQRIGGVTIDDQKLLDLLRDARSRSAETA
jgi:hypothetical protein